MNSAIHAIQIKLFSSEGSTRLIGGGGGGRGCALPDPVI